MNKKRIILGIWATATMALCACSHEEEYDDTNRLADLNINTSIALTRAATGAVTSEFFPQNTVIDVYAYSENTNKTSNNSAKFKCTVATSSSVNTWAYEGSDKIQLSAEPATIYAVYPSATLTVTTTTPGVTGNNLEAAGMQVFLSTSDEEASRIVADGTYTTAAPNVLAASGETDYMYATKTSGTGQPKANNGKAADTPNDNTNPGNSVDLQMNHAMAMVSFRIYNDQTYTHKGSLTKIQLTNADNNSKVLKLGTATMNISTGVVTANIGADNAAITRYIYTKGSGSSNTAGYELHKAATSGGTAPDNNPAFSMLVYPITNNITQNSIKAIFTVDGTDYPVTIPAESNQKWEAGTNYIYTVKLNGKELGLGTVSIVSWTESEIGTELVPVQ